jgi:hypothetical protein
MQKHKFDVMCPTHEKVCFDVTCLRRIRTHYETHRSHKFDIMCPDAFDMEITLGPLEHEN